MAKLSRGNDAVPSWSGFNYQGKITLLSALIEINKLLIKMPVSDIADNYYVEIEKIEDFIIYSNGKVDSLNQVKAYLSKNKFSSFSEASQNLLDHRSNIGALSAKCVLCTPLEIVNWTESTNAHKSSVQLFLYENEHIHVTKVASAIKIEIQKALVGLDLPTQNLNDIYLGLCNLLDIKVANMHNQAKKTRNYILTFNEIIDFFNKSNDNYVATQEAIQKENIYEHIIQNFKKVVDEYCDLFCENKKMGTCRKDIFGSCALQPAMIIF